MRIKQQLKRGFSVFLALVLLLSLIPYQALEVHALTPTYSVSSAYRASSYYTKLCNVQLTGNQRDDIINVALSQVGYTEGSYSGDTGGADDGSYDNYTEYNYWYNNYISSGMPIGGSYAPWCATFVSWCAEQAQIPTSILQRSTAAGHSSWYFNVNFYAGGSTLNSSSDNTSKFMGYNYTPKKGDLFFTRTWSHVGLVVGVSGSYVITVEGNTNDGGSAEGLGVFRRTSRRISDLYFGVPEYVEDYSSSCTYYPAHCEIKVDTTTPINTQPCSVSTEYNSENLGNAPAGQTYTATGLYLNGYGNYWYRIESGYGKTSYLYAGDTTYIKDLTSDITLTGADAPSAHIAGDKFTVSGTIKSQYNRLDTAACYIYSGFGSSGSPVTGDSDSVGGTQYALTSSNVDYNTSFGDLTEGKYTYEISTTYTNYYATSNTSISSNTGKIRLLTEYFIVLSESVDQSTCSHAYTTTMVGAVNCLEGGTQVKSCSKCGLVTTTDIPIGNHSFGGWTTVSNADCTTDGKKTRSCSVCGEVETQVVEAYGHDYATATTPATCTEYAVYEFTCSRCGDYQKYSADALASGWIDFLPNDMSASLFNTQTQYRYSDYETKTSTESSLAGYTQTGSSWAQTGTGSVQYVPSWPSGFSTSSSLYSTYNKAGSKVTPSETETAKTVVNSDGQAGYLYYHWCYADSYYSVETSSGSYTTFHAYYDTTDPSSYTCDTSDMSYKTSHSTCSNSEWWFVTDVYEQKYTNYQKQFTYERWTDFSEWNTTAVSASDTRKVESRTVYQLKNVTAPAGHQYVNGVCSVCGDGTPTVAKDYYLIGYINGADYGCESDYQNMGDYKFVDGKLVATFDQDSYVFLKTTDNADWYMTKSYETGTSATFYNTTDGASEKMLIPGGVEITFALVENTDGSLTLSYTKAEPAVKPSITLKGTTLSLEDEILYNLYFTTSDMDVAPENMGMLVFNSQPANVSVSNADQKIDGAIISGNMYMVSTEGISGKNLADTKYLVAYAKLDNGSYVYSSVLPYSAKSYCFDRLEKSSNANLKSLCVAILNYGAAAQEYFAATSDYTYTTLMNADLTAAQKALVKAYSSDMVAARGTVTASKAGAFGTSANGFTGLGATMSADGIFSINYYFTTSTAVSDVTMYYWNAADFASASTLTTANATGKKTMTPSGKTNQFWADINGIAAKDLDKTIYVCGIYTVGGTTYSTGVIAYSLGYYCVTMAQSGSAAMKPMAAATAVYGYYAKTYFGV